MKKKCIFCGEPPQQKNKEHILPKWLLKLTGFDQKEASIGSDFVTGKEFIFNILNFTMPACTKCNTNFAKTEAVVKPAMEKLLIDDFIDLAELTLLLDWFDKIRLGLQIAVLYLNNKNFELEPRHYINRRVGLKDRSLSITNTYDGSTTLAWTGVNTHAFLRSPNCFAIKINHLIFVNCSLDFLLSEKLGYPYPKWQVDNPFTGKTDMLLVSGTRKLAKTIYQTPLYPPNVLVCQAIFKEALAINNGLYDDPYVRLNSLDFVRGLGKVAVYQGDQRYWMGSDEEISFEGPNRQMKQYRWNRPVLTLQLEIMKSVRYNFDGLPDKYRKANEMVIRYVENSIKDQLKLFDY